MSLPQILNKIGLVYIATIHGWIAIPLRKLNQPIYVDTPFHRCSGFTAASQAAIDSSTGPNCSGGGGSLVLNVRIY